MTAHKLLYNTKQRRDGSFFHIPKYSLDESYELIVVDEISMLPKIMWELLLSHAVHVIALGDPGQLPPVADDSDNHVLDQPHIFLTEIMRQTNESDIIKYSMLVRNHKPLRPVQGKQIRIIRKNEASLGMALWADQIICAKNSTRVMLNQEMRKKLFNTTSPTPIDGEKIICLKNNWDIVNGRGDCLINGMTGTIYNVRIEPVITPNKAYCGNTVVADFLPDFYDDIYDVEQPDPFFRNIIMDYELFVNGKPTLDKTNFAKIAKFYKPNEFDFGYAVTCWKSQGSEYDKVLLYEENFPWEEKSHCQYMYTGVTRAKERLIVVLK